MGEASRKNRAAAAALTTDGYVRGGRALLLAGLDHLRDVLTAERLNPGTLAAVPKLGNVITYQRAGRVVAMAYVVVHEGNNHDELVAFAANDFRGYGGMCARAIVRSYRRANPDRLLIGALHGPTRQQILLCKRLGIPVSAQIITDISFVLGMRKHYLTRLDAAASDVETVCAFACNQTDMLLKLVPHVTPANSSEVASLAQISMNQVARLLDDNPDVNALILTRAAEILS